MQEEALTTGVDDLVKLLQEKGKLSVKDAAKNLHVPESTLQLWIDFLVEERVLAIEYKFTKAYVYINDSKSADELLQQNQHDDLNGYKQEFLARIEGVPPQQAETMWKNEVQKTLAKLEPFFVEEANKRKIPEHQKLMQLYMKRLAQM